MSTSRKIPGLCVSMEFQKPHETGEGRGGGIKTLAGE